MPDYDNNNSGVLFKNDRKTTDNHPDYKGHAQVDGVEYWLAAWIKESRNDGKKFMSLSFTRKDGQPTQAAPTQPEEEEIPF